MAVFVAPYEDIGTLFEKAGKFTDTIITDRVAGNAAVRIIMR